MTSPAEAPAAPVNTAFSRKNPLLQIAWDSTSMGTLKECPRKYQLSIIEGWQPSATSVHLIFGVHYHSALERYDHARAEGMNHEQATRRAVLYALQATWNKRLNRGWISDEPTKTRATLIRSVVWYLEQFREDSIKTVILANGKPAVELSFRLETDYTAFTGERIILCGHLDRLGIFGDDTYVVDKKTTKSALSEDFFARYAPDNQFSTYAFASQIVYQTPVKGLIVDAVQVGATFSRYMRGFVERPAGTLDEWYEHFGIWLRMAQAFVHLEEWPMNDKSCGNYGGCQFRGICSRSPKIREQWLKASFTKRIWDPLQVRGDI